MKKLFLIKFLALFILTFVFLSWASGEGVNPDIICADGYKLVGEQCVKMTFAETLGISLWAWIAIIVVIIGLVLYIIVMGIKPKKHRY
jgi:hypothetical protein